ncbi:MAG: S9 family peptidase [Verrucomicrobia bacterium]|nr:S9 family peptidase [Verrucomicrobiota bacterium]
MRTTDIVAPGLITIAILVAATIVRAEIKPAITPTDYGQWETLGTLGSRSGLSPNGQWLAYHINRANQSNELRIVRLENTNTTVIAFGEQPVFSTDSHWAAYRIGVSEEEREKLRKDKKPIRTRLGLLNLETGEKTAVDSVESFTFSPSGSSIAIRRFAPEQTPRPDPAPPAQTAARETPRSATVIVRHLASGRDTTFGNVSEFVWQDLPERGRLLAMAIATEDKIGNGIQLFDPDTATLRVLDSSSAVYSGLTWRKDSADLVALRSKEDDRYEEPTQVALAWTHVGQGLEAKRTYDPTSDSRYPSGMRIVSFRKPSWSHDGAIVFFGISKWEPKETPRKKTTVTKPETSSSTPAPDSGPPSSGPDPKADKASPQSQIQDDPADVDVWHTGDVDVMPKQKLSAGRDRQRSLLAAWHLGDGRFVQLGKDFTEQVTPLKHQKLSFALNWSPYAMDRSIGRPAADLSLVDITNGERTAIKNQLEDRYVRASPGGRYLLYLADNHWWTIDTTTRTVTNLTHQLPTSFIDWESDRTIKQKPPYGVPGWTTNDHAVILYDKFDLWEVAANGSRAVRLTEGASEEIRYRYVPLDPDQEWIDREKPVYLSLFGIWTKRSGYARLMPSASPVERLVCLDKAVDSMSKAKKADIYAYVVQGFDDSPDLFIAGPDLKEPKQVTATNPFQCQFAWGHSELMEYKSDPGERLQGSLFYPANYEPGRKYPMVVYVYERLSDWIHSYHGPSERDPYNSTVFTSLGFFVLQPDIAFRPREPGLSVVECVGPAVKKVCEMGLVDPKNVGVVGHSWGGFDASFLAAQTELFAAAVAGAPITDLVSNYGNHHWNSGIAETDHIETGQQRMEVPLWEDLSAYIRNSALFHIHKMKTPLLVEVGDNDGTVFWHQGVELYNVARRAEKNVVLLVYPGEDHGLRKKPNQIDYHRRIVEWFGHYLKGEPAKPWITSGVPYLDRQQELKRLKAKTEKN